MFYKPLAFLTENGTCSQVFSTLQRGEGGEVGKVSQDY